MSKIIKIVIGGGCQAQERVRFAVRGKYVTAYDPPKSAQYKKYVKQCAEDYRPEVLLESPLRVQIDVYKNILKSFNKKKLWAALMRLFLPTTKPDVDNYAKAVLDGLNGVVWKDDNVIVDLRVRKFYSDEPRVEVEIEELEQIDQVEEKEYREWLKKEK